MDGLKNNNNEEDPQRYTGKDYTGKKGKYMIPEATTPIGRGATSIVFKAKLINEQNKNEQNKQDVAVAIKIFISERFNLSDPVYWNRFEREILHGQRFNHPNLVEVIDYGVIEDKNFLVMKYIEGESLSEYISFQGQLNSEKKQLNIGRKKKISEDIIAGLKEIHGRNFVHRDLKPGNILIINEENDIRAMICDYGLLKHKEDITKTTATDQAGSLNYMSLHKKDDPANANQFDDIYSLCICLYEIFSGEGWDTETADLNKQGKLGEWIREVRLLDRELDKLRAKYEDKQKEQENYSLDNIKEIIEELPVEPPPPELPNDDKPVKNHFRVISFAMIFFVVCCLLLLGYLYIDSLKYRLTIKTTPEDAWVRIVNPKMDYKPRMELEPGEYHIAISRKGFKEVSDLPITIKDRDIEQKVKLVKLYRLTIKTIPENSQVLIVNPEMKYSQGMELEPGRYDIGISHSEFKPESLTITIPDDIKKKDGSDKEEYFLKEVPQLMDDAIDIPKEKFKLKNSYGMEFVYIPPGNFMTNPENTRGQHVTRIDRGFYIQTTEVTQDQWEQVMIEKPPQKYTCGTKKNCLISPVTHISWYQVRTFIERLNTEGLNTEREQYRLPTEAEWEYACRAKQKPPFHSGRPCQRIRQTIAVLLKKVVMLFR